MNYWKIIISRCFLYSYRSQLYMYMRISLLIFWFYLFILRV